MGAKNVICWDLDETLGSFDGIKQELAGEPEEERETSVLRAGLEETLQRLSSQGYEHYLTSLGCFGYAELVLKRASLTPYFSGILGGDDTFTEKTKRYAKAASLAGISPLQAKDLMLVIGDSPMDKPADLEGVVFLQQKNGYKTSAAVVESILSVLNVLGNGSLSEGFKRMYEQSVPKPMCLCGQTFTQREFSLHNGIELELSYNNELLPGEPDLKRPIIFVSKSNGYEKEPTPI